MWVGESAHARRRPWCTKIERKKDGYTHSHVTAHTLTHTAAVNTEHTSDVVVYAVCVQRRGVRHVQRNEKINGESEGGSGNRQV